MSLQPPLLFALAESRELGARIGEHLGLPLQGKFGTLPSFSHAPFCDIHWYA
jgi:hypothetical protein